jgi:hypothetical protein
MDNEINREITVYEVASHKLEPLLYLDDNERFMKEAQIEQAIVQGDIFPQFPDDGHNFVRETAYFIINPQKISVSINLGFPEKGETPGITEGKSWLAAQIYAQADKIHVQVTGSEKAMATLLGIDLIDDKVPHAESREIQQNTESLKTVAWDELSQNIADNWSNQDYVLSQFEYESMTDKIHMIPPAFWKDEKFITQVLQIDMALNHISLDVALDPLTISLLKTRPRALDTLWNRYYRFLFINPEEEKTDYDMSTSYTDKENKRKFNENDYVRDNKTSLAQQFREMINSPEVMGKLNEINYFPASYQLAMLYLLTEENKKNPKVIEMVIKALDTTNIMQEKAPYGNLWTFYDEKSFSDISLITTIFAKAERISNVPYTGDYIWKSWIEDKDSVLKVLDALNNNHEMYDFNRDHIYRIFVNLPKDLLADKDVSLALMPKVTGIYNRINKELQYDNDVLEAFLEHARDYQLRSLPNNHFFSVTNEEQIKKIVSLLPETIAYTHCPNAWRQNPDIVIKLAHNIFDEQYKVPQKVIELIINDKEKVLELIDKNNSSYLHLPHHMKMDTEIALKYLFNNIYINEEEAVKKIPEQIWLSKNYCLQALSRDILAKYVPQPFWNERGFVLDVMKGIDEGAYSPDVLKAAPRELLQIIDGIGVQSGQYHDLLKKQFFHHDLSSKINTQHYLHQTDDEEEDSSRKMKI